MNIKNYINRVKKNNMKEYIEKGVCVISCDIDTRHIYTQLVIHKKYTQVVIHKIYTHKRLLTSRHTQEIDTQDNILGKLKKIRQLVIHIQ